MPKHHNSHRVRFPWTTFLSGVLLLSFFAACELEVVPNRDSIPEASSIYGTVTVDGAITGDVILLLYQCEVPPPPASTGRPIDFIIVPRYEFDKGEAEFIFPLVVPGPDADGEDPAGSNCYVISSLMDADHDWNPFYPTAGQLTEGDVAGEWAYVDVFGRAADEDYIPLVEDVDIVLDIPTAYDRPVFAVQALGNTEETPVPFQLQFGTQNEEEDPYDVLYAEAYTAPMSCNIVDQSNPKFGMVFATDGDEDGFPDDYNGDGVSDVLYPRILFIRLDPEDETKLTYSDPTVIIPGVVLPFSPDMSELPLFDYIAAGLPFDGVTSWPLDHINFVIPELVVTDIATSATEPLSMQDAEGVVGEYQIMIMNSNGQLWQNPNELVAFEVEGQGQVLTVVQ